MKGYCKHNILKARCIHCNPKFKGAMLRRCNRCNANTYHYPNGKCIRCDMKGKI